jgi:hypothetical protein
MPRGKLASKHLTSTMRDWTDLEIRSLYYLLEQPHLIEKKHKLAIKRVTIKLRNENRARTTNV